MIGEVADLPELVEISPAPGQRTQTPATRLTTARGSCLPFGPSVRADGINFAVFSRHAQIIHLVLFHPGREEPFAEIPLDPIRNKTGDVWHVLVQGLTPDILYGYRVNGPFNPRAGHRFNPRAILLDPYAPIISGGFPWGVSDIPHGSGRLTRRSGIVCDSFDWG